MRSTLFAGAASFAVYAIPLVTVHWVLPFGVALAHEITSDRPIAWKLADVALALGAQVALFGLVRAALARSRRLAAVVLVGTLVPAAFVLNGAYLVAIPAWFLIDTDPAEDVDSLTEACSVAGYSLAPVAAGLARGLEERGEAVLVADDGTNVAILGPDCRVEPVVEPAVQSAPGLQQVLPDGAIVFSELLQSTSTYRYWLVARGADTAVPLPEPDGVRFERAPVVADEGTAVAWPVRANDGRTIVAIEPMGSGASMRVTPTLPGPPISMVLAVNMTRGELVVVRELETFAGVGLDGGVLWGPTSQGELAVHPATARRIGDDWLWWDAYREDGPYRLAWWTREGKGRHAVPKGRHITAAALHPAGRYVAASTTTSLSIGSIQDAVFVLDSRDGTLVWRRTLRAYARSLVAFLGRDLFAYSDLEETGRPEQPLTGRVRVLRLPPE
jgi:hypothetical protein